MAELYTGMDGAPIIGPELRCVLNLLYNSKISDGMDQEKALSVLTALPKEELHCEWPAIAFLYRMATWSARGFVYLVLLIFLFTLGSVE